MKNWDLPSWSSVKNHTELCVWCLYNWCPLPLRNTFLLCFCVSLEFGLWAALCISVSVLERWRRKVSGHFSGLAMCCRAWEVSRPQHWGACLWVGLTNPRLPPQHRPPQSASQAHSWAVGNLSRLVVHSSSSWWFYLMLRGWFALGISAVIWSPLFTSERLTGSAGLCSLRSLHRARG